MNAKLITSSLTTIVLSLYLSSCGISPKLPSIKPGDIARFSFRDLLPSPIPVIQADEKKWIPNESGAEKSLTFTQTRDAWSASQNTSPFPEEVDLPTGLPIEAEDGLLPPKPQ
jgi:hypothetical protein